MVLYTGLFDIENSDAVLLPEMTTQVYFVASSASNVLVVPMGALSFIKDDVDQDSSMLADTAGGAMATSGQMPAEITDEMRERFRQMREAGGGAAGGAGGFPGAGGFAAGGAGRGGMAAARVSQPGERSRAKVTVMLENGKREEREVLVGLTSRVNAEVVSGLKAGEQVIAGVAEDMKPASAAAGNTNNFRPQQFMRF